MAYREDGFLQLPVVYLREEVRLVLYGVWRGDKPFVAVAVNLRLCNVAGGYIVIVMTALLVEGATLDKAVAHSDWGGGTAFTFSMV